MNSNMQEGYTRLFEEARIQTQNFNRKLYEVSFEEHYKQYKELLAETNQLIEEASDKEALVWEIASIIPDYVNKTLAGIEKKSKGRALCWIIIWHWLRMFFRLSIMDV